MLQLNTEIRAVDKIFYSQGFSPGFAQNEFAISNTANVYVFGCVYLCESLNVLKCSCSCIR